MLKTKLAVPCFNSMNGQYAGPFQGRQQAETQTTLFTYNSHFYKRFTYTNGYRHSANDQHRAVIMIGLVLTLIVVWPSIQNAPVRKNASVTAGLYWTSAKKSRQKKQTKQNLKSKTQKSSKYSEDFYSPPQGRHLTRDHSSCSS